MRISIWSLSSVVIVSLVLSTAEAQQQRAPSRSRTNSQGQNPRVANRPRVPQPGQNANQAGQTTKQEILSTIMSQVVMGGLNKPTSLTIQPKTNEVFIAEGDTCQVSRLNDVPGAYRLVPAIQNLGADANSTPLSIAFVDKHTMLVGVAGQENPEQALRIYRVPPAGSIDASNHEAVINLPVLDTTDAVTRFAFTAAGTSVFVAGQVEGHRGWVARGEMTDHQLGELTAVEGLTRLNGPSALSIGRNAELIVAQMGSATTPSDSTIAVYDLHTYKRVAYVAAGLHDVVGLAVSPKSNRIYAVDFASAAPEQGGLFRLDLVNDDGETICKPTRLMPLDRPSALAFTPDGTLFITTWGSLAEGFQEGCLVRIYEDSKL